MGKLTIETIDGPKVLVTEQITAITGTALYNAIAVVHHGEHRARSVYLNAEECRMMIGVSWPIRRCRYWGHNQCWGGRQHLAPDAPPSNCVGCQLRAVLREKTGDDLRIIPEVHPSPLKSAVLTAGIIMAACWLMVQPYNEQTQRLHQAQERAQRAEARLAKMEGVRR